MYEFHYDYIKNKFGNKSRLFFTDTHSLMFEIKMIKDEMGGVDIEEFVRLKPNMYLFLVDDSSEHKGMNKVKGVNKNAVAKISHNLQKDVFLDKKCLRHSMNRIKSENDKITKSTKFLCCALR